ncbi:MAG: hypothetical protein IT464_03190 [Planctomycetes bacterium]|nr:hypothetical protein [Planctomycetota bacterium]
MSGSGASPVNTRPYGNTFQGAAGPAGSFEEAALHRAATKLAKISSNQSGDAPVGFNWGTGVAAILLAAIPGGLFALLAWAAFTDKSAGATPGMILTLIALLFVGLPFLIIRTSKPDSPKKALKEFYRAVGRGNAKRAMALVTNADKDSLQRRQPVIPKLGRPSGYTRSLNDADGFKGYWNELVRTHPAPYCLTRVSGLQVQEVKPGVVIADFELTLTMNTQLWWILILVALLLAALLDILTRKVVKVRMRKVLVQVGEEWKLFNGEWQGYEEMDLRWLDARA